MSNQKEIPELNLQALPHLLIQNDCFLSSRAPENGKSGNYSNEKLTFALNKVRIELGHNRKNLLIEKIKKTIIELVYYSEKQIKMNFSDYLSQKIGYHYTYMANLFSKVEGSSIQKFIIVTKIERVKELLMYENLSLTEIAFKLHYSSVAHLSNQFKKVTGSSPSHFLATTTKNANLLANTSPNTFLTGAVSLQNESTLLQFSTHQMAEN